MEPRDLWAWENLIIVISLLIMRVVESVLCFFSQSFFIDVLFFDFHTVPLT